MRNTRYFATLGLWNKRGRKCHKRNCDRVPQWGESGNGFSSTQYSQFRWCDEHAMERIRKYFGLAQLSIEQPDKVVSGSAR